LLAGAAGVPVPLVAGFAELAVPELVVPLVLLWLWRFTFGVEFVWLVAAPELFPVAGAAVLGAVLCAIKLIADKVKIELMIRVFIFVLLLFCVE
jgi:purine-cytosine permease-like protein